MQFELHRLGWRSFQDLTAILMQEVLGGTFHTFADSNDAGRDGAFFGSSALAGSDVAVNTVVQCKFSAKTDGTLPPSMLQDELSKVAALRERGLCDSYIIVTNMRASGRTEAWLRDELGKLGIRHGQILDGVWIGQQVHRNPRLRRLVPRLYGLGDLSQILDERAAKQGAMLLAGLQESLSTFVPTSAYRQASEALDRSGFVLVVGEPGTGKSTIAAVLALATLDGGARQVLRVTSPADMVAHLNPDDPDQLFWIDDAFGAVRHDVVLSEQWKRQFDLVVSSVRMGAKVIATSRTQLYRESRAYRDDKMELWLQAHQVLVDVADLTVSEKTAILYNHLREGNQPEETLARWTPSLPCVAELPSFLPEIARRLGSTAFVHSNRLHGTQELLNFFEHPTEYLLGVLRELPRPQLAALSCVFVEGGRLTSPVTISGRLLDCVSRLGADVPSTMAAFAAIRGSLLTHDRDDDGSPYWSFHHPTLREAFTLLLAEDPNALEIIVEGLTETEIARELYCGGPKRAENTLEVPPAWYDRLARRITLGEIKTTGWVLTTLRPGQSFLIDSCSNEFLRIWAPHHPEQIERLLGYFDRSSWHEVMSTLSDIVPFLVRLAAAKALHDDARLKIWQGVLTEVVVHLDSGWLDERYAPLLTDEVRSEVLAQFRIYSLPRLKELAIRSVDWDPYDTPTEQIGPALRRLSRFEEALSDDQEAVAKIRDVYGVLESRMVREQAELDLRLEEARAKYGLTYRRSNFSPRPRQKGPFEDLTEQP